jgi:hypothetical protein
MMMMVRRSYCRMVAARYRTYVFLLVEEAFFFFQNDQRPTKIIKLDSPTLFFFFFFSFCIIDHVCDYVT